MVGRGCSRLGFVCLMDMMVLFLYSIGQWVDWDDDGNENTKQAVQLHYT